MSPSGDAVAFLEHPVWNDNRGSVAFVTTSGEKKTLTPRVGQRRGLAWSPGGDEIWFTGRRLRRRRSAPSRGPARMREVWSAPSDLTILDVAPDGRVLMTANYERAQAYWLGPGDAGERDISWMSFSRPRALAPTGAACSSRATTKARAATTRSGCGGSTRRRPVRLGPGEALQLSPDGTKALAIVCSAPRQLLVLPTGAGEPRSLTVTGFNYLGAGWYPDGRRVVFVAERQGQPLSAYTQDLAGGAPIRLGVDLGPGGPSVSDRPSLLVSPDGKWFAAWLGFPTLVPMEGSQPRRSGISRTPIFRLDGRPTAVGFSSAATLRPTAPCTSFGWISPGGAVVPWKEIKLHDLAGIQSTPLCFVTPDGRTIVYSTKQYLTDLYLVAGLR